MIDEARRGLQSSGVSLPFIPLGSFTSPYRTITRSKGRSSSQVTSSGSDLPGRSALESSWAYLRISLSSAMDPSSYPCKARLRLSESVQKGRTVTRRLIIQRARRVNMITSKFPILRQFQGDLHGTIGLQRPRISLQTSLCPPSDLQLQRQLV